MKLISANIRYSKRKKRVIGIFGYGNMGQAIVTQLQNTPTLRKVISITIYSLGVQTVRGARCVASVNNLLTVSNWMFLCLKPQDFYKLKPFSLENSRHLTIISIMAGVRIANIQKVFPGAKIVRTMPNLPLQVGQGVIGWYFKKNLLNSTEHNLLKKIFSVFGLGIPLRNERMLDALTAVSGSGPAYVFLFSNALVKAARQLGFSKAIAEKIVTHTITGSLMYAISAKKYSFEDIIHMVQSKGGTTEAALNELNTTHYYRQWQKAINKAYHRAQEISSYEID